MATFYVGKRPVLRGREDADFANPYRAKKLNGDSRSEVGTYSHYTLFGPGLLTGAPDNDHVPGTGYSPHDLMMTRRFLGLDVKNPMDGAGEGARIDGMRYRPMEYRGLLASAALASADLGVWRESRTDEYQQFVFDGVGVDALSAPGHVRRSSGGAASFGAFDPWVNKGVSGSPLDGASQTAPEGTSYESFSHDYGRNRVNEWRGVPSAQAL